MTDEANILPFETCEKEWFVKHGKGEHLVIMIILFFISYIRVQQQDAVYTNTESHWCGCIRGMVAREGFVYEQKPLSVTRNVVV